MRRALGEAIDIALAIDARVWNTMIDRNQLENVILNLAINARDAMEGSGKLTIELGNAVLDDGYVAAHADLAAGEYVADGGVGQRRRHERGRHRARVRTVLHHQAGGRRHWARTEHGVRFRQAERGPHQHLQRAGEGSTIRIYLPRCHEAEHATALRAGGDAAGGSETILVVEDDAAVRLAVGDMLAGLGYTVLTRRRRAVGAGDARSGAAPDLLFTDVVMPGTLRSPELARHARRLLPAIAVLFTSGYTQNAIVHAGRLDAGVELLSKPYRRSELAAKVRQVLDARPVGGERPRRRRRGAPARCGGGGQRRRARHAARAAADPRLRPLCFGSADGVLDALRDHDILLTDVTLPGMSGIELARLAVGRFAGLRVVFASGRSVEPQGFAARVLPKPFTLDQLSAVLS